MNLQNYPNEAYFTKMMYESVFAKKLVLCKASNQELSTPLKLMKAKQQYVFSHARSGEE